MCVLCCCQRKRAKGQGDIDLLRDIEELIISFLCVLHGQAASQGGSPLSSRRRQSWVTTQTRPPSGGVAEPCCPFPACPSRSDSLMRLIKKEKGRSCCMVFLHPSGRFFSSAGLYCPLGSGAGSIWQLKHLSHQVGVTGALLMLGLVFQPPWGSAGPCCSLGKQLCSEPTRVQPWGATCCCGCVPP